MPHSDFHKHHSHIKHVGKTRKMRNHDQEPEIIYTRPVAQHKRGNAIVKYGATATVISAIAATGFGIAGFLGGQKTSEVKINQDPMKREASEQQFYQLKDGTKVQISPRSKRPLCSDPFVKQLTSDQQAELIEKFPAMDGDNDKMCG